MHKKKSYEIDCAYNLQLIIAPCVLLCQDGGQATVDNISPKISKRCPIPRQMVSQNPRWESLTCVEDMRWSPVPYITDLRLSLNTKQQPLFSAMFIVLFHSGNVAKWDHFSCHWPETGFSFSFSNKHTQNPFYFIQLQKLQESWLPQCGWSIREHGRDPNLSLAFLQAERVSDGLRSPGL